MFLPVLNTQRFYKYFSLTVFLLMQCLRNGAAIKCFVCDSSDNPSCADLKSNSSIVAEECTLDKMKSIDTWLFELNKFKYFDTGKIPIMNCQKVIAKDPHTNKIVTARFCQLSTGASDACAILQRSLKRQEEQHQQQQQQQEKNNNNNNKHNGRPDSMQEQHSSTETEEEFHCSICTTDNCNGVSGIKIITSLSHLLSLMVKVVGVAIVKHIHWQHTFSGSW